MSNRKTFNDFLTKISPEQDDYIIGFDIPDVGGEKKFKLSSLKDFVQSVELKEVSSSGLLPSSHEDGTPDSTLLNGKIFQITGDDNIQIILPNLKSIGIEDKIKVMIVNLTSFKRVEVTASPDMKPLMARGVSSDLGMTASTYLKKKFDTGIFYYDGECWFGYGDVEGPANLNIKNVFGNYQFTLEDEDKILHFKNSGSDGVTISLPEPEFMVAGTQFFVHNISDGYIKFIVPDSINFYARASFLRKKYDDAVVYTDGVDWFATGDLS